MQANAVDINFCRRICDEFRVTGSQESKDGRMGFRAKVLVDFLTCENGFSASIGHKYADSRFDAVSRIGKILVKSDLIHHYRDALEFDDDDGFFRFLDDEPALYFEKRQTVLSLISPIRPVRPGQVLWMCEDILLGSDLEVWNCAVVLLHQSDGVTILYAYREYYDKCPKFSVIVRDSVRVYRLNDTSKQQIAVAIKSSVQDGASFMYSLLFHHHWFALSFASVMMDCGAVYSEMTEESTAEAACAAIAAHLSFNDFSDTLDSALQLIEETDRPIAIESETIVSTPAIRFFQKILAPENVYRIKYFMSIKFCKTMCSDFSESEMDPKKKAYWRSIVSLFTQILNIDGALEPFFEGIAGDDPPVQCCEHVLSVLRPTLELVLKSLEVSVAANEDSACLPALTTESEAVHLVSRIDTIEKYWRSLELLCEEPHLPPHREFVRFDFILHRRTSQFVFSKCWRRHFFACRSSKLYYRSGSADTKEGLEKFIESNPQDDYKYCVPLTGCTVEPLENRGSYFPFLITIFRSKDQEPVTVVLAADDEKTRKQCIAVIKVASTLTHSAASVDEDSGDKDSIITRIALQPNLLLMKNQAALDGVFHALTNQAAEQGVSHALQQRKLASVYFDDHVLLKQAGFSLETLRTVGVDVASLRVAGWSVRDLKLGGVSVKELHQSGCTPRSLFAAGFSAKELKDAGLSPQEMRSAGVDLVSFKTLGYDMSSLTNAGFDSAMLTVSFFDGRFDPLALKQSNFTALALKSAGFSAQALRDIGFDLKAMLIPDSPLLPPLFDVFTLTMAANFRPEEIASIKPTFEITEEAQKIRASLYRNELPSFVLRELFGEGKQCYLLYDSFTDGDTPRCFHRSCDLKGPNLTLVSSREGFVVGAYTSASWDSDGGSFPSPGAFVVPLINRESIPRYTKFRLKDEADEHVIICDNCSGPRFHGTLEIRGGKDKNKWNKARSPDFQFSEESTIQLGFTEMDMSPFEGDIKVTCKSFLEPLPGFKAQMLEMGGMMLKFFPHRVQVFSITNIGDSLNRIIAEAKLERGKERARNQQQANTTSVLDEDVLNIAPLIDVIDEIISKIEKLETNPMSAASPLVDE